MINGVGSRGVPVAISRELRAVQRSLNEQRAAVCHAVPILLAVLASAKVESDALASLARRTVVQVERAMVRIDALEIHADRLAPAE